MPRRVAPRYYDTPPLFFPEQGDWVTYDEAGRARERGTGRFTFSPDTLVKDPSPTIYPPRPRSQRISYDPMDRTLRIQFRNGRVYGYYEVPPNVWRDLKASASTGRFINRRLDPFYEYGEEWPADIE